MDARVLWDMVDGPMPRGLLGVGIGDIHRGADAWTLYLGGYSTTFRNRLYRAEAPLASDPFDARWRVDVDARGRARPLIADPPKGAWDAGGMHTPSYLPPLGGAPARIYYAGRAGRQHVGSGSRYAIGVLDHVEGRWHRRDEPILSGSGDRPSVLEPRVVRDGTRYVMWYLSTPHEVARGEQPDFELRVTTSADGIGGWSESEVFATTAEGFFDVALAPTDDGWTMVLARGTNLHGTTPYPPQGLWLSTAAAPSPHRGDWSAPRRILDTDPDDTPAWMGRGVCDPAVIADADGSLTVFVTGTRRHTGWASLARDRLRAWHRPPPPAPFFLAAGVLRFAR
jgi:hypothetical protein